MRDVVREGPQAGGTHDHRSTITLDRALRDELDEHAFGAIDDRVDGCRRREARWPGARASQKGRCDAGSRIARNRVGAGRDGLEYVPIFVVESEGPEVGVRKQGREVEVARLTFLEIFRSGHCRGRPQSGRAGVAPSPPRGA